MEILTQTYLNEATDTGVSDKEIPIHEILIMSY